MTAKKYEFDALIRKNDRVNSGYIDFPFDVRKEFGGKGRVKVKALIDGHMYQGSLVKMGGDCHLLGITQQLRKETGKNPGDIVHVVLEEDTEERIIETPEDLLDLLKKVPSLLEFFYSLSYTHRKEYVRWIVDAKKDETRKNRLVKAVELLKKNVKTPG
jgi:bifunctional DNA-binding transcriptional regulator/antitoxin component of YhaV-PrlF toxin-antitoxin module